MGRTRKYRFCEGCPLDGNPRVFGAGADSPIVFIGQNPGAVELQLGEPFVGPAGVRLEKELWRHGFDRKTDLWITNVVKCWTKGNAVPPDEAVEHCKNYLKNEWTVGPKIEVVVALGRWAQKWIRTLVGSGFLYHPDHIVEMTHPSAALRQSIYDARFRREMKEFRENLTIWQLPPGKK